MKWLQLEKKESTFCYQITFSSDLFPWINLNQLFRRYFLLNVFLAIFLAFCTRVFLLVNYTDCKLRSLMISEIFWCCFFFGILLFLPSEVKQIITAWCCFSITPENIRKPLGFPMFSEGIEKQHQTVMG